MAPSKPTKSEALAELIRFAIASNEGLSGIPVSRIVTDRILKVKASDNPASIKRVLTRRIKPLIESCKAFKIGRTLAPDKRSGKYEKYKTMHVLCEAKQSIIEELEAHYIHKYFEDPKNDNKKHGSAGPAGTSIDGKYYLYLVLR